MWQRIVLALILPAVSAWLSRQERRILRRGMPLAPSQLTDAIAVRVRHPERVRLLRVRRILWPTRRTIGLTAGYGILIRADFWGDRGLLVHELAHTAQSERAGGIEGFLRQYLAEWLDVGYPGGALETEASRVADRICARDD